VLLVAGCAPEAAPLLREDLATLRTELRRVEQGLHRSQADLATELRDADRQTARALSDVQKSLSRLTSRLDELARDAGQAQSRLDELRRRVDGLAAQTDASASLPVSAGTALAQAAPSRPSGPGSDAESRTTGPPRTGRPPSPGSAATDLYQTAYIDYTRGNYNLAIAAFREFIRLYPSIPLAEKAQYWIGESHFSAARGHQTRGERERARREFERAIQEFERLLVAHPQGDRVPAALYKQGLALLEVGQPGLAEARLQLLADQYPGHEEGAKALDELARLRKR
jgi:TolA-binding protein